jgi:hypothetical protein
MSDSELSEGDLLSIIKSSDDIIENYTKNKPKVNKNVEETMSTPVVMEATINRLENENLVRLFFITLVCNYRNTIYFYYLL